MLNILSNDMIKPAIHTPSTAKFWDDEHISKGMLEAHLHSDWDAASRKETFINESVNWISTMLSAKEYPVLLVLNQTIVINENAIHCYNIWEHCFTENTLIAEMKNVGFSQIELYGDVAGKKYNKDGTTLCAVLTK